MQKKVVKRIKKKSLKQESKTARDFGGRILPGSGAIEGMKGDARTSIHSDGVFNDKDYLIENKFTESDGYVLNERTWNKIKQEALRDGMRIPLMQVDIEPSPYEKHSIIIQEVDPDFDHLPLGMYVQARRSKTITPELVPSHSERTIIHFGSDNAVEIVQYSVFLDVKFPGTVKEQAPPVQEPEKPKSGKELAREIIW